MEPANKIFNILIFVYMEYCEHEQMASPRALRLLDGALMSYQFRSDQSFLYAQGEGVFSAECIDRKTKGPASGRREGQYIR
jgi:hypothetical protein